MYSNPDRRLITIGPYTWTADETFFHIGPKGKACRLYDYGVYGVTTAFAGATTTPTMSIGTSADPDAYGEDFDFGTLADNSSKSVRSTYRVDEAGFATYFLAAGQTIAADTQVNMKCIGATGGGAAGVSHAFMILDYDW